MKLMNNMEKGTVVFVANTHWHFSWQTANSVVAGFAARGYRVLFVEPIPKRWPRLSELKRVLGRLSGSSRMAGHAYQSVPDRVSLISPLMLPDVDAWTQGLNKLLFVRLVVRRVRQQATGPMILIHCLPVQSAIALQHQLKSDVAIYRCVYDWSQDPHSRHELAEADLLAEVDMAWADCEHNLERVTAVQNRAVLMPPAVDLSLFTAVSYNRSGQVRPVCVYFGTVGLSLDLDLLRQISHRYTLRLIGPVRQQLDGFAAETEIIGPVPHERVASLIRDADVLLLPYNKQPHMGGVIPAKLFECLITGKPIVATNLTTIDEYRQLVYLCEGQEAVFAAIESAQTEDETLAAHRIACARENSWDQRLNQMEEQIQMLLEARPKKDMRE